MATKKHVDFAINGEQATKEENSFEETQFIKDGTVIPTEEYVIIKLANSNRQGGVHIPCIDDIYNPATKKIERARVVVGHDSIWLKDQQNLTEDYVRQNLVTLTFPRGQKICRISPQETNTLEFISLCRHNIGNPDRKSGSRFEFFIYDPKKEQEDKLKKEMLEIDMAIEASKQPAEAMRKHAHFLGVQAVDEYGFPKSEDGIRREYILAAKRNPTRFKETLGSKEVEISFLIKKAVSENFIEIGGPGGNIKWANGGLICKVPGTKKPFDYLIEFAMNDLKNGSDFVDRLEALNKK